MVAMAVGWELYERTHTGPYAALALAMVGLTQVVPMVLLTLPAGHVADNYDRKKVIVLMMLVVFCASLGLTLTSVLRAPLAWIYVCLFVGGAARTFLWAASASFLPLLPRDDPRRVLQRANGIRRADRARPPTADPRA